MKLEFATQLEIALRENKGFVLFRKPNELKVNLFIQDHSQKNRFLMHSFDSKVEKIISTDFPLEITQSEFHLDFPMNLKTSEKFTPKTQKEYEELIKTTIHSIQISDLRKVVISRLKPIENKGYSLLKSYKTLLDQHPQALVFLWHNPGEETWMGATPELLLSQKGVEVKTVSLAGTKLPEAEWTEKEFDEQKIVTDYIVEYFSAVKQLKVIGPETVQAGKFQHLKSYISGEVSEDYSLENLVEKLHPTPALCGLPKRKAFEFIQAHEGYHRGFYSGYLGIEAGDSKEYFVNLRSAQIFQDKIWLYVGGGITADSNPENEWNETELKSGTLMNALTI